MRAGLDLLAQLRELPRARVDYTAVLSRVVGLAELARFDSPARWLAELAPSTR